MRSVEALLREIIDYAGVFPPASLDLAEALENYEAYQSHPHSWMLARFVLPEKDYLAGARPRRISLVVPAGAGGSRSGVEMIETKGDFEPPPGVPVFYELDWRGDFERRMRDLKRWPNAGVKLRTGGESGPPFEAIAEFVTAAARHDLPIKFTAGLHSPLPKGGMHGFLNVFAAAFMAYSGMRVENCEEFRFTDDEFHAGRHRFTAAQAESLRHRRVISFGSCSFLEPVEHLRALGWLA